MAKEAEAPNFPTNDMKSCTEAQNWIQIMQGTKVAVWPEKNRQISIKFSH